MKRAFRFFCVVLFVLIVSSPSSARADVAPPSHPPGANPGPDSEVTQVRMVAETVVIDILPNSDIKSLGQAKVTADFTMRNLGSAAESMGVRFPISSNNGFGELPELKNLNVKVDGKTVATKRIMEVDPLWSSDPVPWAEFNATFPPNQDVQIQVTYILDGTGEYPYTAFSYVLHTGAGWKDTIGSADLIVRLPYEANAFNVIFDEEIGWSATTPGGALNGKEVKWHFENLEPDFGNDFQLSLVNAAVWKAVLKEQANVQTKPNDGEAWGRLGKLYKEIFFFRRGFRHDAGGEQLYAMSVDAYTKAVTLKPDDALWHAGFANLLAIHAYYAAQEGPQDMRAEILRSMQEIQRALELKPNDPKVKEIAETIYYSFPDAIQQLESGYDFLWLTATPELSTSTLAPVEPTLTPPATTPPLATATAVPAVEASPTPVPPTANNPLCPSAFIAPLALILFARKKRRDSGL
ncbi:MAG: hypothetical protein ABI904_11180 [Chloroflexota bacterium]